MFVKQMTQSVLTKSYRTPVAISVPTLNPCTLATTWGPWTAFSAPVDEVFIGKPKSPADLIWPCCTVTMCGVFVQVSDTLQCLSLNGSSIH